MKLGTATKGRRRGRRASTHSRFSQTARWWRNWLTASRPLRNLAALIQAISHQWRYAPRRLLALAVAADRSSRIRAALFVLIGAVLVSLVISKSYVAYLIDSAPKAITDTEAIDPTDLLNLAERDLSKRLATLSGADTTDHESADERPTNIGDLRAQTAALLRNDPLNARVFRVWGHLAHVSEDEARANAFMQAAARRSLRQSAALYWVMQKSYERGDYTTAAYYADALLRTRPQLIAQVTPTLARMAENDAAQGELTKLLAGNPPWRRQFFSSLPTSISDARTPLNLLLSLRETAAPPATADLQTYVHFLIKHNLYEIAYYAWLQFLPPEQLSNVGFLFNGSFETDPSTLPFDWVITRGSGVTIDLASKPDEPGGRALFIEFGYGRVDFRGVSQLVMLAPGSYQFEGKYKGDVMGRRGLLWRIACAGGARIGQSDMVLGTRPAWREFAFAFTVPNRDCRAQSVSLVLDARSASEQFVTGSIWYDDLQISRRDRAP